MRERVLSIIALVLALASLLPWAAQAIDVRGVGWPLRAPDGSQAAPSYAFASDESTGFTRDGAGNFLIVRAGVTRVNFGTSVAFFSVQPWSGAKDGFRWDATTLAVDNPSPDTVSVYLDEATNRTGGVGADCALVARLSTGVEVVIATLVTDGGCP